MVKRIKSKKAHYKNLFCINALRVVRMVAGPLESFQLRASAGQKKFGKIDVSVWKGREKEGRALSSTISLRFNGFEKSVAYLNPEEALKLSAILENYAVQVMRLDTERRLLAWREKQDVEFIE